MATALSQRISEKSQGSVIDFYRNCHSTLQQTWNMRERMRKIDQIYQRELDYTEEQLRAQLANRSGDPTKFQNITVPVVLPAVETAVTYQSSVFLTGIPLFGVSASAQYMDSALQMETILDDQATKGGWAREFQLFFRDGFKYNLAAMEIEWAVQKTFIPSTNLAYSKTEAKNTEVIWEGNRAKRLDPYNLIFDPRVIPADMSTRGEFVGYTELCSKVDLIQQLQNLPFRMNYKEAMESGFPQVGTGGPNEYYIPQVNSRALLDPNLFNTFDWLQWAGMHERQGKIQFKNSYLKTVLYARICPSDFGIPSESPNTPQIYKFIIINGQVIVHCERQTNAHNRLPILLSQPLEDGLGYQTKSLATNSAPFQEVASALMNSAIQARRRAIGDRGIYNPSMINAKDIANDSATAKIPLRPAAYGQDISRAYYAIPFRDDQSQIAMQDIGQVLRFNEMVTGQNAAQQGQFVKGNKTLQEFDTIMGNAAGRSQNTSILLESQFFTPFKELCKLNILQYQKASQVYNRETEEVVVVDPVTLRKAVLEFKISDGLTPASKQMNTEAFQSACQTVAAVPAITGAFNIGPMFSYLFKQQRANIAQFEKSQPQVAYEQAMGQWSQTVQSIAESLSKTKNAEGVSPTPEEIQKSLPPQPLPEQFGYQPGVAAPPQPAGTIMNQYAATSQPQQG